MTTTKKDLVELVSERLNLKKEEVFPVIDQVFVTMRKVLITGHRIEIRGFGTFKVRRRKTRMARNPRTGDPVKVPSRAVPVFKPSKELRAQVATADEG